MTSKQHKRLKLRLSSPMFSPSSFLLSCACPSFVMGTQLLSSVSIQLLVLTYRDILVQNLTLGYESKINLLHLPHFTEEETVKC